MAELETIKNCISCAVSRGVFDEGKAKKYNILTSKAIQKRYITASRKKKIVSGVRNYLYDCIVSAGNEYGNLVLEGKNAIKEEVKEKEEVNEQFPEFDDFYKHYPKKKNKGQAACDRDWETIQS